MVAGASVMSERKYALMKLAPGDWLLPSNDHKTLWRIATYTDGPSTGMDHMPRDKEFWGVWKWVGRAEFPRDEIDLEFGDSWAMKSDWHETRREAVDAALDLGSGGSR